MNKLKLLYAVVKTLKSKEAITGILTAEVQKDQKKIFFLHNEFEKNLATRQVKAKIATELDYDGKAVKHESNNEFTLDRFCEHGHHPGRPFPSPGHGFRHGGFRGGLTRLSLLLSLLDALQATEQEDKSIQLTLNSADLPADLQTLLYEKLSGKHPHHRHHGLMNEFATVADPRFMVSIFIDKSHEIQKAVATLSGSGTDEHRQQHALAAKVELTFVW
ncbi:hypothetical protein [Sporomusa termitida]|uniref:Uncharacterized protein n=1 Tax=Sporomusa termitida TaxID=2377 RepID=A0A517DZ27_9FIRM|nr:hypothetical protein [Sporomusa termitida]QDR82599.1 hypothetical protein SPTER_40270 [Sporomusa termitida]